MHARRRVPQPLDKQGPVTGGELVGGEHRIQHHPAPGPKHPGALRQHPPGVADAGQDVATPHQVAGVGGDRQGLQVALDEGDPSPEAGGVGVGKALGEPRSHQVDTEHLAAIAPGQRDRVGGIPTAGIEHELAALKAQPARRVQQHLRCPGPKASLQQRITVSGPALAGVELGQDPADGWIGHDVTLAEPRARVERVPTGVLAKASGASPGARSGNVAGPDLAASRPAAAGRSCARRTSMRSSWRATRRWRWSRRPQAARPLGCFAPSSVTTRRGRSRGPATGRRD
jgi:hypothetical protein